MTGTAITGLGDGNGSVVVTAGHCLGDEGDPKKKRPWKPARQPMFIPQPKIAEVHDLLESNASNTQVAKWLLENAWFARVKNDGKWVGFAPKPWMEKGAWDLDFGAIVMAPRDRQTILDTFGGVGIKTSYQVPAEVLALGYPSKPPFAGRTLFICVAKVKRGVTIGPQDGKLAGVQQRARDGLRHDRWLERRPVVRREGGRLDDRLGQQQRAARDHVRPVLEPQPLGHLPARPELERGVARANWTRSCT